MLKYCTSSTYRKHYSNLQKLNLISDSLQLDLYAIGCYVLAQEQWKQKRKQQNNKEKYDVKENLLIRNVKVITNGQNSTHNNSLIPVYSDLNNDLQVFKNITPTPIKLFKSLLLIHCHFLLVKICPDESQTEKLNKYFKWISEETTKMIQKQSTKQTKKNNSFAKNRSSSCNKNSITPVINTKNESQLSNPKQARVRSQSCSEKSNGSQQIISQQALILSLIIKPYILYLQKALSILPSYHQLIHSFSPLQSSSYWPILNLLKLIGNIAKCFSHIGRYFYKQYSPLVYLLIQVFHKEISRFYPKAKAILMGRIRDVQHLFFQLCEQYSEYAIYHDEAIHIDGVEDVIVQIDEMVKINDALFHLYLGKYFYKVIQKLKLVEPRWLQISSKQCQFVQQFYKMKYKKRRSSCSKNSIQDQTKQNSSLKLSQKQINPPANKQKLTIQRKPLVLTPKTPLKLKKQTPQQLETLTFRVRQMNGQSDQ